MASTTAEVMLYFGVEDKGFESVVNELRFSDDPHLDAREIIDLITPIWDTAKEIGYDEGYESALNDNR